MRKASERVVPSSCFNSARDGEMIFVLLGRDASAPVAIRAWIQHRLETGKNQPGDEMITEAETCAQMMERERAYLRKQIGKAP